MSISKTNTLLIAILFVGNICVAQNKKKVAPTKKDTNNLAGFLKDLNKDLLTNDAVQNQPKDKPLYKTLFVYYDKDRLIVSPVKNGL
jgi:hypothetical protein